MDALRVQAAMEEMQAMNAGLMQRIVNLAGDKAQLQARVAELEKEKSEKQKPRAARKS